MYLQRTYEVRSFKHCCREEAIRITYFECVLVAWGTAVAQWLRCCATNRKVAGSITGGGVIGIFH